MIEKENFFSKIYDLLIDVDKIAEVVEKFILFSIRVIVAILVFIILRKV